jgi:valyl-tRNA synthetase
MPFITEEIWQLLDERKEGESIMVAQMPDVEPFNPLLLETFENMKEAVTGIRKIRLDNNISPRELMELRIQPGDKGHEPRLESILTKLGNLSSSTLVSGEVKGALSFRVKSTSFFIPLEAHADPDEELKKLEDELAYTRGFLASVLKKLGNEKFVSSAPAAVVEKERTKQADAEAKIKILEERVFSLKG